MSHRIATPGEVMMRLQPPGFDWLDQTRQIDVVYVAGKANVFISPLDNYHVFLSAKLTLKSTIS